MAAEKMKNPDKDAWMEKTINDAQRFCEEYYDKGIVKHERRWLHGRPTDSYGVPEYLVDVFVREGSPPKAIIMAFRCRNTVWCFTWHGDRIKTYKYGPSREVEI